jgi:hypothetical protein
MVTNNWERVEKKQRKGGRGRKGKKKVTGV